MKNNGHIAQAPGGLNVYRGPNKFDHLFDDKPQAIFAGAFAPLTEKLLSLKYCERPELIILADKSALNEYNSLPAPTKKELNSIKFVTLWPSDFVKSDYFHGVGLSVLRALENMHFVHDQRVLVIGYGKVGSGVAYHLKQAGYPVSVYDTDPAKIKTALDQGFDSGPLDKVAKKADIVINATDGTSPALTPNMANYFEQPTVYVFSVIVVNPLQGILIKDGYTNKHHTTFIVDNQTVNFSHDVGGADLRYFRVMAYTTIYLMKNYPSVIKGLIPFEKEGLLQLSPNLDTQIAAQFSTDSQFN